MAKKRKRPSEERSAEESRRKFLKKLTYVAPLMLTFQIDGDAFAGEDAGKGKGTKTRKKKTSPSPPVKKKKKKKTPPPPP